VSSGRIIEDFRFQKHAAMWIGVCVTTFGMTLLSIFTELCSWTTVKKEEEGFTETLVSVIYQSTRRSKKSEIFISTALAALKFRRITASVQLESM
jgi:hypothetical protein